MQKEQKITFKQFMDVFNFRVFSQDAYGKDRHDTKIVRFFFAYDKAYDDTQWFEFGVYDFGFSNWELLQKILSKDICESYVDNITYNSETGMTEVWLNIERECVTK